MSLNIRAKLNLPSPSSKDSAGRALHHCETRLPLQALIESTFRDGRSRPNAPVDRRIAERLAEYLRVAMGATARHCEGKIGAPRSRIGRRREEGFSVEVDSSRVVVTGTNVAGLLQGVYWLQDRMESDGGPFLPKGRTNRTALLSPRYLYSFFALYGDPLLEADIDPFPEGYLERLGRSGIGGIWMQAVLSTLAPSKVFPEFGQPLR